MTPSDLAEITRRLAVFEPDLQGRRVLITGAAGFLGQHLTAWATGVPGVAEVVGLDNTIVGDPAVLEALSQRGATIVRADLTRLTLDDLPGPWDLIVHAAGLASPGAYRRFPLETLNVGVLGTRLMLDLAVASDARLLVISSSEIYGDPEPAAVPTPETYPGRVSSTGPRACYDEAKRIGETYATVYADRLACDVVIARPFNVFGPGMTRGDHRVVPSFTARALAGEALRVYGTGRQTRTYCYVTDAVVGLVHVLLRGQRGEPYNVGQDAPEISALQLADALADAWETPLPREVLPHPDDYPGQEPQRRCPDLTKARTQLGYAPEVGLTDGLRRFITWATETWR